MSFALGGIDLVIYCIFRALRLGISIHAYSAVATFDFLIPFFILFIFLLSFAFLSILFFLGVTISIVFISIYKSALRAVA